MVKGRKLGRKMKLRTGLTKNQTKSVKRIAKKVAMQIPERKVLGFIDENRQLTHNKTDYLPN